MLTSLLEIAEQLNEADAGLRSVREPWADTTSPAGRMVFTVFAVSAEFERELIQERTRSGRVAAMARGVRFGRPLKLTARQIALARLVSEGTSIPEASKVLNVHRVILYRALHS
jgi:DNA invertase Pin-like site-specific DNA recombinase